MTNVFKNIAIGVIIFIVCKTLITAMVTGTDTSQDNTQSHRRCSGLAQTLVPLAVGVGVAIYAVVGFLSLGSKAD